MHTQEFPARRRAALVALIATVPERVAPLLAALAFDAQLSFGMRLEVRMYDGRSCSCGGSGLDH
jgi:hypothetical protein